MANTIPDHITPTKIRQELGDIGEAYSTLHFILAQNPLPKSELVLLQEAFGRSSEMINAVLWYMDEHGLTELS